MKIETDIIVSIATNPNGLTVQVLILHVEIFKTDVIGFTDNFIMCLSLIIRI